MRIELCYTGGNIEGWHASINHITYMFETVLPSILKTSDETKKAPSSKLQRFSPVGSLIHPDFPCIRGLSEKCQIDDINLLHLASKFIVNNTSHVNIKKATMTELKSLNYHAEMFRSVKALTARLGTWETYKALVKHISKLQDNQELYNSIRYGKEKRKDEDVYKTFIEYKGFKNQIKEGMQKFNTASKLSSHQEGKEYNISYNPNNHVNYLLFIKNHKICKKNISELLDFYDQLWENVICRTLHSLFFQSPRQQHTQLSRVEQINNSISSLRISIETNQSDVCLENLKDYQTIQNELSDLSTILGKEVSATQPRIDFIMQCPTNKENSIQQTYNHQALNTRNKSDEVVTPQETISKHSQNKQKGILNSMTSRGPETQRHNKTISELASFAHQGNKPEITQSLQSNNGKGKIYPPESVSCNINSAQIADSEYVCPCCNRKLSYHDIRAKLSNNKKCSRSLGVCPMFEKLSPRDKRRTALRASVCLICLCPGHTRAHCTSNEKCRHCGSSYNTLICRHGRYRGYRNPQTWKK